MRSPSPDNLPRKCIDYYNNILFNNNDIFDEEYKYIRYRSPSPEPVEKYYKYIYYILSSVLILEEGELLIILFNFTIFFSISFFI